MYSALLEMKYQAVYYLPYLPLHMHPMQGEMDFSVIIDRSAGKMSLCKSVVWGLQTHAGQTNLDATMECVWRAARSAMVTQSAGTGAMRQRAAMGVCLAQTNSNTK
jgi:hypothetical protein